MVADSEQLEELCTICPSAEEKAESGVQYVFLPQLRVPGLGAVDALLRPGPGPDGYTTRLFLAAAVPNKGTNWTQHRILDRTWHCWSWNNVPANARLAQILANHLKPLR
jgi:hypothetical protein